MRWMINRKIGMRPRRRCVVPLLAASLCVGAVTIPVHAASCDHSAVEAQAEALLARRPDLSGLSVLTGAHGLETWRRHFGAVSDETIVPLASASKLASAVLMLMLVDDGLIGLDEPVASYLPQFTGEKGQMTLRQMFSHTAGLPGDQGNGASIIGDRSLTLAEAVDQIACCVALIATPGEAFSYGGVSMHVAGRVAEVVTGEDFEALFRQRVSEPLGITSMDYQGLGETRNYRVAGSLRSSVGDYGRLLMMLSNGGVYQGRRLLSEASVAILSEERKRDRILVSEPPLATELDLGYGFGAWLHGNGTGDPVAQLSSKGAFDGLPWIDLQNHAFGIILLDNRRASLNDEVISLFDQLVEQAADPTCRQPIGMRINAGLSGSWYAPQINGQGLMIDILAEQQTLFGAWFSYDLAGVSAGNAVLGAPEQRWLTLQGPWQDRQAELIIHSSSGGQFGSASPVSTEVVGQATLRFDACDQAELIWQLDQIGQSASLTLERLTEEDQCVALMQSMP